MKTIEERAEEFGKQGCGENCVLICDEWKDKDGVCSRLASRATLYKSIAEEQRAIDEKEYTGEMRQLNEEWKANLDTQRAMLIDKACEWLRDNYECWLYEDGYFDVLLMLEHFRKAMEEV